MRGLFLLGPVFKFDAAGIVLCVEGVTLAWMQACMESFTCVEAWYDGVLLPHEIETYDFFSGDGFELR